MKSRLTITLEESILEKVDQFIDGHQIRNRSHAIESLLDRYFAPKVTTAVILAGGPQVGSGIRTLTPLDNKPVIVHIIEHLQKFGVHNVIIATNEEGKKLEEILPTLINGAVSISYVYEQKPRGTAGALKAIANQIKDESFFVWSGDVFTTIDLSSLLKFHLEQHALITVTVKPRLTQASYDNVFIQGNTVVDFQKSKPDQEVSLANAGVYVFSKEALELIPKDSPVMLEQDILPTFAKSQKVVAFPFQGLWMEIPTH